MSPLVRVLCISAFSLACNQVLAQMNIAVEDSAKDMVGSRLVFSIRERIRQSAGFKLVSGGALFKASIVTLDPNESSATAGYSTVYSVVFTAWQPQTDTWIYLSNYVGTCGSLRVAECADGIVADADKAADTARAYYRTILKK